MNARFSWAAVLLLAAGIVCLAIACALVVHSGCVDPGPPVSRPEPGTPRAGYCETMDDPGFRIALIAAAAAVLVALAALTGRRRWVTLTGAALIAVGLIAHAAIAHSLTFAYTI